MTGWVITLSLETATIRPTGCVLRLGDTIRVDDTTTIQVTCMTSKYQLTQEKTTPHNYVKRIMCITNANMNWYTTVLTNLAAFTCRSSVYGMGPSVSVVGNLRWTWWILLELISRRQSLASRPLKFCYLPLPTALSHYVIKTGGQLESGLLYLPFLHPLTNNAVA